MHADQPAPQLLLCRLLVLTLLLLLCSQHLSLILLQCPLLLHPSPLHLRSHQQLLWRTLLLQLFQLCLLQLTPVLLLRLVLLLPAGD